MRHISKTFSGMAALKDVSLSVRRGEVHALMGENGAGKSTLMKILSGAYRADPGGSILIDGTLASIDGPEAGRASGIAVIYQELSLAPNLTVAENIFLGREHRRSVFTDKGAQEIACRDVLSRLGLAFSPSTVVSRLSLGERQLVEIARALASDARILVMDEPTTSLSTLETERLYEIIASLKVDGIGVIYISHRMEEIYTLSDRVSVLRDGQYVGTLARDEITAERLVAMMVGRDVSSFYKKDHRPTADRRTLMSVREIGDGRRIHGCSFDLKAGEVLCLAGLVGSGRTELARLVYGADPKSHGTIAIDGQPVDIRRAQDAIASGIVYLTEDRRRLGLFLDMSISDNININVAAGDARYGGFSNVTQARERAGRAMTALAVRATGMTAKAGALSGGNQQKVLLARLLETKPRVLILDEPTRGVDVGAKSEIYRLIDDLAANGIGVLMISSELPEVIGVADRVLVMRDGRIVGEINATPERPIAQEAIMAYSTGAAAIDA
ncbi:sugar ABC transporter ATP-binding protein [Pleomorphomonas sp. JP5]|uniref:sugar ABC transporter ATP-binding protein n=1 Tax=Pleomorphomonas sp. JP5 TaxID=2942998 RepID=UPI00204350DD|nr:sugar ABC transporter ATP-binding protein [Pleomorphomonas sp. JP5]MCM5559316.1 sugar ABC transporter ATP-binding protein [Pleomorphomonas sp. JP5]